MGSLIVCGDDFIVLLHHTYCNFDHDLLITLMARFFFSSLDATALFFEAVLCQGRTRQNAASGVPKELYKLDEGVCPPLSF